MLLRQQCVTNNNFSSSASIVNDYTYIKSFFPLHLHVHYIFSEVCILSYIKLIKLHCFQEMMRSNAGCFLCCLVEFRKSRQKKLTLEGTSMSVLLEIPAQLRAKYSSKIHSWLLRSHWCIPAPVGEVCIWAKGPIWSQLIPVSLAWCN